MAASKTPKLKVTFSIHAPDAQLVQLAGDFTDWEVNALALTRQKSGLWKKVVSLVPGRYEYRFLVDGHWTDDPTCSEHTTNPFGGVNCVIQVA